MGRVDLVFDERTGRELALKRLRHVASSNVDRELLFEREYQTLVELAHPRIIEVYDYGIDDSGRYYTMELLDGTELLNVIPLDWRKVCAILRDVASALALLHSRRQLHRDITARNVHVARDGRAKLIDFGTLTTMGVAGAVIGTPPHLAPEAVYGQPLDARVDMYALGALAYHALTGRHAYPAQRISQLRDAWRSPVIAPIMRVADIPEELNRFVLSLLALNRSARPGSAAEVMERLTAIAGLTPDENPAVATAYLSTPTLVGRDQQLLRFRQSLVRAVRGRGSATAIIGRSGMGRSRLLTSFQLEARVLGATTLHASGGSTEPYATVRQLMAAVLENHPEFETRPAFSPTGALHGFAASVPPGSEVARRQDGTVRSLRPQMEAIEGAVTEVFRDLLERSCVLVTIDDLHRCDPASAVVLVRLAQEAPLTRLRLVVSYEASASDHTIVQVLSEHLAKEELLPLDLEQTEALFGSLFGEVPHVKAAAAWAFNVSNGSPALLIQLAQHLVDGKLATYESGVWSLPRDLSEQALPQNLAETWVARLNGLSPDARIIAAGLALCDPHHPLARGDLAWLLGEGNNSMEDRLLAHRAFSEIQARDIVRIEADVVRFAHSQLRTQLVEGLETVERERLHGRLANAFRVSNYPFPLVVAYHLYEAGDEAASLELALLHLRQSADRRDDARRDFALEARCLERALATARRLGRPRAVTTPLLVNLLGLAHRHDRGLARYFDDAVAEARVDIGLQRRDQVAAELGPDAGQKAIVLECMRRQSEVHALTSAAQRGLPPVEAADALARSAHRMAAVCLETLDANAVEPLPDVIEPIACTSPAIAGVQELAYIIRNHILGLPHEHGRIDLVERWRSPVAGMPDGARMGTIRLCTAYNGWFRAEVGATDAFRYADELEAVPAYETLTWDVRFGAQLYQGNTAGASQARERRNVLLAQHGGSLRGHCVASMYHEVRANALCGDLMGVKRALDAVATQAEIFPSWKPILRWARAEYHRLRGEPAEARIELEAALANAQPGRHRLWCWIAAAYVEVLLELAGPEPAVTFASGALARCEEVGASEYFTLWLGSSAALALAARGDTQATALASAALDVLENEGGTGLPLARLLENQARVAASLGDRATLTHALTRLRDLTSGLCNTALAARFEALVRDLSQPDDAAPLADWLTQERHRQAVANISSASADEAPGLALKLLLEDLAQSKGLLFVREGEVYRCVAAHNAAYSPELECALTEFMQAEIAGAKEVTATAADLELLRSAGSVGTLETAHYVSPSGERYAYHPLRFVRDGQLWICAVLAAPLDEELGLVYSQLEPEVAEMLARLDTIQPVLAAG